jgi:predicted RecA/RadA family phage recombinase
MSITYARFLHGLSQPIDHTPVAAVSPGDVIIVGNTVLFAKRGLAAGEAGSLDVGGVWDLPRESGANTAWAEGDAIYWDAANHRATKTSTNNKKIGIAVAAAADGNARGKVLSIPQG